MKKFFISYHAPAKFMEQTSNSSPEEMKEGMKAWMDWAAKCGDALVDFGSPLGNGSALDTGVKCGQVKENLRATPLCKVNPGRKYSAFFKGHPHLSWAEGCDIELHEIMPTPGS